MEKEILNLLQGVYEDREGEKVYQVIISGDTIQFDDGDICKMKWNGTKWVIPGGLHVTQLHIDASGFLETFTPANGPFREQTFRYSRVS